MAPYTKNEIAKLENIQRRGARFITKDYKSREDGCMTKMLEELNLPTLATRRQQQRLIFFYKVVEGQIPAIPSKDFIKSNKPKRLIRAKTYSDCETTNIVQSSVRNNSRSVIIPNCKTDQYRHSFFVPHINGLEPPERRHSPRHEVRGLQSRDRQESRLSALLPVVSKPRRDSTTYPYRQIQRYSICTMHISL